MNRGILKNAKFFLKQYAEILSDRLILSKSNLENDIKISKQEKMDEDYRKIVLERIKQKNIRINNDKEKLVNLELTISGITFSTEQEYGYRKEIDGKPIEIENLKIVGLKDN